MTRFSGVRASACAPKVRGRRTNQPAASADDARRSARSATRGRSRIAIAGWACLPDARPSTGVPICARACHSRSLRGARMSGKSKLTQEQYEELLKPLTKELSTMARWVSETGQRMRRPVRRPRHRRQGRLDRHVRAGPQSAPVPRRRACRRRASANARQWYFQRYVEHLAGRGRNRRCSTAAGTTAPASSG